MKNRLLLSLLLLFLFNPVKKVFAQSWIEQGQSWEYVCWSYDYSNTLRRFIYLQDTIIQGKTCQVIDSYYRYIFRGPPIGEITNISSEIQGFPEITYTSGDSVFYYEESLDSFYLVFNWAAQPGDSWRLFDLDGIQLSEECDSSAVIVDSIGTFNFSGQVLRWISLSGTGTGDLEIKGKIFEKFGAVGHYFLFNNADCSGSSHREFAHPLCYTHPSLGEFPGLYDVNDSYNETNGLFVPLTNTTSNCNAYVELSLPEVYSSIDLRIFPQPADEILTINFNNQINGKYKIYNLTGNLMLSDVFIGKNAQINVSQLPSGFYTIHISGDNFVKSLKILIK